MKAIIEPRTATRAFSRDIESRFQVYVEDESKNKSIFTATDRTKYRNFLANKDIQPSKQDSAADQQQFRNQKSDAVRNYELDKHNQLCRRAKGDFDERIVACTYDAFRHIVRAHSDIGHGGVTATYQELSRTVYGIARKDVQWLLPHCQVCLVNRPNTTRAPLQPIISQQVLERVQGDLIDMRHQPDGHYKWILHFKDHFSKFSVLYALTSKRAIEIADGFSMFVRHYDVPDILQTDNGREFKGALLIFLKRHRIRLINGRPRTPQTQGLVEQANGVVKDKLRKWQEENGSNAWAHALTEVTLFMNRQHHSGLPKRTSPYEVMFGRKSKQQKSRLEPVHNQILDQLSEADIEDGYSDNPVKFSMKRFDEALYDMLPVEPYQADPDSDPENPLLLCSTADNDRTSAEEGSQASDREAYNRSVRSTKNSCSSLILIISTEKKLLMIKVKTLIMVKERKQMHWRILIGPYGADTI